uniref:Uncharacterized protein n=1 Tax=Noccaea caerulescens TaxID=107243 RepID=A0A1J3F693_NOCCA
MFFHQNLLLHCSNMEVRHFTIHGFAILIWSLSFSNPQLLKSMDLKFIPGDPAGSIHYCVEASVYCGLRELRIEFLYASMVLPASLYACGTLETLTLCRLHVVDVSRPLKLLGF